MNALALMVIALSGYFSFAKTRDGTNPLLSVGEAVLVAAMFSVLLGGATLWLSVEDAAVVVEDTLSVLGLAFLTALLGAFSASLKPRREQYPIGNVRSLEVSLPIWRTRVRIGRCRCSRKQVDLR